MRYSKRAGVILVLKLQKNNQPSSVSPRWRFHFWPHQSGSRLTLNSTAPKDWNCWLSIKRFKICKLSILKGFSMRTNTNNKYNDCIYLLATFRTVTKSIFTCNTRSFSSQTVNRSFIVTHSISHTVTHSISRTVTHTIFHNVTHSRISFLLSQAI